VGLVLLVVVDAVVGIIDLLLLLGMFGHIWSF
jgi:hypothetical protein